MGSDRQREVHGYCVGTKASDGITNIFIYYYIIASSQISFHGLYIYINDSYQVNGYTYTEDETMFVL